MTFSMLAPSTLTAVGGAMACHSLRGRLCDAIATRLVLGFVRHQLHTELTFHRTQQEAPHGVLELFDAGALRPAQEFQDRPVAY
jgi:hypothetical protein